jgi:hypothetical protein
MSEARLPIRPPPAGALALGAGIAVCVRLAGSTRARHALGSRFGRAVAARRRRPAGTFDPADFESHYFVDEHGGVHVLG